MHFRPRVCVGGHKKAMWWKKYNPQGGSLIPYIITQGRLRCTCQPCAIESITPDRVWAHRVWLELSNVQYDGYGHTVRLAWTIECTM